MSAIVSSESGEERPEPPRQMGLIAELWTEKPAFVAACFLILLLFVAIFAPFIAPYNPGTQSLSNRLIPPIWMTGGRWDHFLGTDNLGRDMFSRVIYGAQASLGVGLSVVAIAGSFGVAVGLIAGYAGGAVDRFAMRVVDAQLSMPDLLLALIVLAVIGPSFLSVVVVLSLGGWMIYARTVRGIVVSAKRETYVEAAEMIGARPRRVLFRHILPNLVAPILTLATLELASVMLAEAALSFLGMGIQPPMVSWGLDIATGREFIFSNSWLVTLPGLAISSTILSVYIFATWVRRTSDPVEREKRYGATQAATVRRPPVTETDLVPFPARTGASPLLEIRDLAVTFLSRRARVPAVRGVSLTVYPAETLGVVGESGSGKSVTMQAVMGLIDEPGRIEAGDILWRGKSMFDPATGASHARGKDISIVFQDAMTSLNPLLTVGTQITEVLHRHTDLRGGAAEQRAVALLEMVGIRAPAERLKQLPGEFSGGMRQRMMLAMSLAAEPDLLIADEPTTALDVTVQAQIVDLLVDLRQRLNLAVLLVTHDLGLVAELSDRVAVMYAGRVVETGPVDAIFATPAHPYTAGLIRSTPQIDDKNERWTAIEGSPPDPAYLPTGCAFRVRCNRATAVCARDPTTTPVGPGHSVACWHPLTVAGEVAA